MESLGTGAREGVQTFKVIKKKPGEEISSCQALIYRVIANGTHWIGERLFIDFAGRRGFIIDRCCLLAPIR